MKRLPIATVSLFLFGSLSAVSASASSGGEALSVRESVGAILVKVRSPSLTTERCEEGFAAISREIADLRPDRFGRADVERNGVAILRETFETRLALRADLKRLQERNQFTERCATEARRLMRHLRGIEDFVGVSVAEKSHLDFGGGRTKLLPKDALLNPRIADVEIRSGDVLLSRGNASTSALIARMADEDTQFSHLSLVYIDPKTKKAWTVEAHIEFGSILIPLEDWLKDGKARTVVFRHPDATLAHEAARRMFHRVRVPFEVGKPIKYDFAFDMNDHERLFCSEIISEGYRLASRGQLAVPLYPSRFTMENREIMDRLGIRETRSFLPADMEVDPRFDIVAEWRDFGKTPSAWKSDAILTAIYAWVEKRGYRFDPTWWQNGGARLAKGIRWLGFLDKMMPEYMPRDVVEMSFMLDMLVGDLGDRLAEFEAEHRSRTGYAADFSAYLRELERIREEAERSDGLSEFFHP